MIWKTTDADTRLIAAVAARADLELFMNPLTVALDLTACHVNGNPLDLDGLLHADKINLAHDIYGINRHIDHDTGRLMDFFVPRYSKRERDGR